MFLKLNPVQYNFNIFQNRDLFEREQQVYEKDEQSAIVRPDPQRDKRHQGYLSNTWSRCQTFVTGTLSTTCVFLT